MPDSIVIIKDTCSKHLSGRIPILDTEMWVDNNQIMFNHYSKPMSSKEVVLSRSMMSNSMKRDILVQEGGQQLRNCLISLPWEVRAAHVMDLMVSMARAGHNERFRETVLT